MSKWGKQDIKNWESSEVFNEFEKIILKSLMSIEEKILTAQQNPEIAKKLDTINKSVENTSSSMKGLLESAKNLADDSEEIEETEPTEDEQRLAKESLLKELNEMATKASDEGNYKLAYKIERSIDTIMFE